MSDFDSIDRTYSERWAGDAPTGDDDFGPVMRGRHRRLTAGRAFSLALNAAIGIVLILVLVAAGLGLYASAQISRQEVTGLSGSQSSALNVLVVGSDSRDGFTPEELLELGTEAVDGRRTDTIFVLSIDGGRAAMLSLPRDLFVTQCDGVQGRINAAFARGGPTCLAQTIEAETGIGLDHYVEVNLFGFVSIVDAVGGVPIFLDEPLVDAFAGVNLPAGCQVLDGTQAIGFVRARHVDSDLGRIARQQRFLRQLAEQVASPSTLVNVPRLFRVAGAAGDAVIADDGLGILQLAQIARAARGLAGAGLATFTVPANAANIDGAAVLVPDAAAADALYDTFRTASVLQAPVSPDVAVVQPGEVPVQVLNGAGVEGLAANARIFLEARGFTISGIGNAPPVEQTVVRHPQGLEAAAQLVADQIPGATTEANSQAEGVVLVLGPGVDLSAPAPPPMEDDPTTTEEVPVGAAPVPASCTAG